MTTSYMMLQDSELARVRKAAMQHGLTVVAARRHGVTLEIIPKSLDALPNAFQLRTIADELGGDGVRYVALAIELDQEDEGS